ncbi:Glutamyl/glutaminyl-tRNA synthetase [Perilla frutescens var. hirtella]|nr:Glutamyl/glutaminyl-tRNA synthetase [Perilla frutescens var. hirtella]
MELHFAADSPPLPAIAAARIAGISLVAKPTLPSPSPPALSLETGQRLHGANVILRYFGRISSIPGFYGQDAYQTSQIDEWIDYALIFGSGSEFEGACGFVDGYLLMNTFLVGNSLSIADITVWAGLAGAGLRWESLRKSKKYQNLSRWFNSISAEYDAPLSEFLSTYLGKRGSAKAAASKSKEPQASNSRSTAVANGVHNTETSGARTFEVDLPDAEVGKVKLRFAPEPSGYLHIGHSKAALLNQYFADRYKGQVIVRFDDTNPDKESSEFVDNLLKDIETLGIKYSEITYTSDHFPQLMDMAEKLIREGKAYVDDTPREKMQQERMDGIESSCRNNSVEENLKLWKEMTAGSERGLMCCVRGKLNMQDPNKSLRDPVYYRCNLTPHHRIGAKYKIYPTYDFCCPFVDAVEGITHALRSSEYHDRNDQYYRIQTDMGFRKVHIYEFSRLNMVYTLLSKRKLLWFVQNGKVESWDDPRFPTVQGIVRRGLKIEALIQFILEQGASKNLNLMEWDKLWAINKKIIDPVCPRHTAVIEEQRVLLVLTDGPKDPFVRILPKHKKYEGAGEKAVTYSNRLWIEYADAESISVNEEITLKDWGNAIVKEIKKDENGIITQLVGVLHLEGNVKKTKLKLTWLPDANELVRLTLVDFDYLITKKKLEEDEDFVDVVNPCTRTEASALGESDMRNLKRGDVIQLERKGYYRCDVPMIRPSKPIVLFAIPDGKQQTVANYSFLLATFINMSAQKKLVRFAFFAGLSALRLVPLVASDTRKHNMNASNKLKIHKMTPHPHYLSYEIKLHGFLLWASVGFLMPLSILIKRTSCTNPRIIFYTHAITQVLAVLVAAAGGVISIKYFDNSFSNDHQIIGLVFYAAIWLQTLLSIFRPPRGSRGRNIWFVFHWVVGIAASLLGVINVFTGLQAYNKRTLEDVRVWTISFVIEVSFMLLVYLLQEKWHYLRSHDDLEPDVAIK